MCVNKSSRSWCIAVFAASAAARWTNGVSRSTSRANRSSSSARTSSSLNVSNVSPPPQSLNFSRQRNLNQLHLSSLLGTQSTLPDPVTEKTLIVDASSPEVIIQLVLFPSLSSQHSPTPSRQSTENSADRPHHHSRTTKISCNQRAQPRGCAGNNPLATSPATLNGSGTLDTNAQLVRIFLASPLEQPNAS
jgi:hypothetical protein